MICDLYQPEESGAMNARKYSGIALAVLALAAGTAWAGSPDRIGTSAAPDGTGETISPPFSTLGLTYARKMTDRVNFGATVTYDAERVLQETAAGVSFGFGFQYDTDYRGVRLGMAMNNFGSNMQYGGSDLEHLQQLPGYNPFVAPRDLAL